MGRSFRPGRELLLTRFSFRSCGGGSWKLRQRGVELRAQHGAAHSRGVDVFRYIQDDAVNFGELGCMAALRQLLRIGRVGVPTRGLCRLED